MSALALPALTVGAILWFVSALVSLPERSRRVHQLAMAVGAFSLVVAAAIAIVEPSHRFKLMIPYVVASSALGIGVLVWAAPQAWELTQRLTAPRAALCLVVLAASLLMMWTQTVNPFLYYQF